MVIDNVKTRAAALEVFGERERYVNEAERLALTGISRTTWYRREKLGVVPYPRRRDSLKRWLLSDLLIWMLNENEIEVEGA